MSTFVKQKPDGLARKSVRMVRVRVLLERLCRDGYAKNWRRTTYCGGWLGPRWADYTVDSKSFRLSNETLGARSYLYFYCYNSETIQPLMEILRDVAKGCPYSEPVVCCNGGPEKNAHIEMRVSNFKGLNWWL